MSGVPFHQTGMGRNFYEFTFPQLNRELARLNCLLEQLIQEQAKCQHGHCEKCHGAAADDHDQDVQTEATADLGDHDE